MPPKIALCTNGCLLAICYWLQSELRHKSHWPSQLLSIVWTFIWQATVVHYIVHISIRPTNFKSWAHTWVLISSKSPLRKVSFFQLVSVSNGFTIQLIAHFGTVHLWSSFPAWQMVGFGPLISREFKMIFKVWVADTQHMAVI